MRPENLTQRFQEAITSAQNLAIDRNHQFIEPAHVLSCLIEQENSTVKQILLNSKCNINRLNGKIDKIIELFPEISGSLGEVRASSDLIKL